MNDVPDAPDFLLGTIKLRGEVLAVLDVRGFFGMTRASADVASSALVLGKSRIEFALLADQVEEVATFRTPDFFEATDAFASIGRKCVRGVSSSALTLLNAAMLLTDPSLFVDET